MKSTITSQDINNLIQKEEEKILKSIIKIGALKKREEKIFHKEYLERQEIRKKEDLTKIVSIPSNLLHNKLKYLTTFQEFRQFMSEEAAHTWIRPGLDGYMYVAQYNNWLLAIDNDRKVHTAAPTNHTYYYQLTAADRIELTTAFKELQLTFNY